MTYQSHSGQVLGMVVNGVEQAHKGWSHSKAAAYVCLCVSYASSPPMIPVWDMKSTYETDSKWQSMYENACMLKIRFICKAVFTD
jgi:hypothetical protein